MRPGGRPRGCPHDVVDSKAQLGKGIVNTRSPAADPGLRGPVGIAHDHDTVAADVLVDHETASIGTTGPDAQTASPVAARRRGTAGASDGTPTGRGYAAHARHTRKPRILVLSAIVAPGPGRLILAGFSHAKGAPRRTTGGNAPPMTRLTRTGHTMARKVSKRLTAMARERLTPEQKRRIRKVQRFVLGHHIASRSRRGILVARASFGAGAYREAARQIRHVLSRDPTHPGALELASRIAAKQGAFTEAATYAVRRVESTQDPRHWKAARKLVGRIRETDPRWQPVIGPRKADHPYASGSSPTGSAAAPATASRTGRILYLVKESRPFLHNGFCTRSHETLRALVRSGRDMLGVTMPGFPGVLGVDEAPQESVVEEVTYRHLLPAAGRQLAALGQDEYVELTARMLAGVVARERPALLHVSSGHRGFESALAGNAVARWAGIPWIYEVRSFFETTWTDDPVLAEQGEYYERRFATETRMMQAADLVVTLSGPMRDEIVERHGIPAEKVRVIGNAVDISRFVPKPRDEALRRRLGLDGSFTLGYVSNLSHPREGQEVLIEAIAKLRAAGHAVTGLIVGDGPRRASLERLAAKRGVSRRIVFTGSVPFDEVASYYAQIDLFVVPRVNDRAARMVSPLKPFEAMAMRVPLLVADLPALREIVADGERGHTFRTGDSTSLAEAAARLLDDDMERKRLVDVAASWVATERSWTSVAAAFGEVYDALNHGAPTC